MAPTIVSRAQWGARPATHPLTPWPSGQPTGTDEHWEGAGGHADHSQCAAEVRSIQAFHFAKGYWDIAYNWLVCQHGVIFEGRPAHLYESAAQKQGNSTHIATCYIGGPLTPFTEAAKRAMAYLNRGHVQGHRDEVQTSCPGDVIEAWIHAGCPTTGAPSSSPVPPEPPLPLPSSGIHHPTLAQGSVGPAVMELQQKLNGVSGAGLTTDGNFGPRTKAAVESFQSFFHLGVDGIAGPQTWGLLDYCAALKHIQ